MATRLYMRSTTTNASSGPSSEQSSTQPNGTASHPTFTARDLKDTKGTSVVTVDHTHPADQVHYDGLMGIFISDSLAAGSIASNTWQVGLWGAESNAAANTWHNIVVYVWRPGTGTKVGSILDTHQADAISNEVTDKAQVISFSGAQFGVQAGDRLVFEWWHHWQHSMSTAYTSSIGFNGTTDITDTLGDPDAGAWIETPQDNLFGAAPLTPESLTRTRAQGSPTINPQVAPAGQTRTRAQGSPTVTAGVTVTPASPARTRTQGSPAVNPQLRPAALAHTRAQGAPKTNPQTLPAGLQHTRAQGSPAITAGATLEPASLEHTRAQGAAQINPRITFPSSGPSGLGAPLPFLMFQAAGEPGLQHARAQGAPTVTVGAAAVTPASLTHTRAQGDPTVHPTAAPTGLQHTRAQGAPTLNPQTLPAGLEHTRAQGTPVVSPTLGPASLEHTRAQGTPQTNPQISPAGLAHTRAQGDPTVTSGFLASPASLTHTRAQGAPTVSPTITPAGLVHTRTQGSPTATVPSVRQLGNPNVTIQWVPRPAGLEHTRAQGTPTTRGLLTVTIEGLTRDRQQGTPQLSARVLPEGLQHTRTQGNASVNPRTISPASISHTRAQGAPTVTIVWIARPEPLLRTTRTVGTITVIGHMLAGPPSLEHTRAQGTPALSGRALPASLTHTRNLGDPAVNVRTLAPPALARA